MSFLQDIKAAMTVALAMIWTGITNVFEWLPANQGTITWMIGIVIAIVTLRNQLLVRNRTKLENDNELLKKRKLELEIDDLEHRHR